MKKNMPDISALFSNDFGSTSFFLSNGLWGSSPQQNFYKNKRSLLTKQKEKGNIQNNNKL